MSKYKGLFTFDEDNHKYIPIARTDGIIDTMDYEPDSKPTEPLIKDEKVRKAVRAWWDCCQEGIEDKRIYIIDAEFRMGIYRLDLGRYYFFDDKKEGFYTIAELCGGEEE